jgi:hypothetical protein
MIQVYEIDLPDDGKICVRETEKMLDIIKAYSEDTYPQWCIMIQVIEMSEEDYNSLVPYEG